MTRKTVSRFLVVYLCIIWGAVIVRSDRFPLTWAPMYSRIGKQRTVASSRVADHEVVHLGWDPLPVGVDDVVPSFYLRKFRYVCRHRDFLQVIPLPNSGAHTASGASMPLRRIRPRLSAIRTCNSSVLREGCQASRPLLSRKSVSSYGAWKTPASVMIAVTRRDGVTSKAGL